MTSTGLQEILRKLERRFKGKIMEEADVVSFLRCPYAELVDFAMGFANLTKKEAEVVKLCGRLKYTQAEAAEEMQCSEDAVQQWYRAAKYKLKMAWSGRAWIMDTVKAKNRP